MTISNFLVSRFSGKNVHFAGKDSGNVAYFARFLVADAGGTVVPEVDEKTHYLVVGSKNKGTPAAQKQAEKLNKKGASIQILGEMEFGELLLPDSEALAELLRAGQKDLLQRILGVARGLKKTLSLSGVDLSGTDLSGVSLGGEVSLKGANLSRTKVEGMQLGQLDRVTLDQAVLRGANVYLKGTCSLRGVQAFNSTVQSMGGQSDLSGARFEGDCNLKLNDCCLENAEFATERLYGTDFSRANLRGATFGKARTRGLIFQGADLSGADFTGADLLSADFSGAKLNGADFTGADLTGVKWDGADTSGARGIEGEPELGPHLKALDEASRDLSYVTSIVVDLNRGKYTLTVSEGIPAWNGQIPVERWGREHMENDQAYLPKAGYAYGMALLARRFKHGQPRLDSFELRFHRGDAPQLREIALKAWGEAFRMGLSEEQAGSALADPGELRKRMVEQDLCAGRDGVSRWNARSAAEFKRAGPFSGIDASHKELTGARFGDLDLSSATFAGSDLERAQFHNCDLRQANFEKANLQSCNLAHRYHNQRGCKAQQANFRQARLSRAHLNAVELAGADLSGADLSEANLIHADLSRANLKGANLKNAELSYAELNGCDLSGATLDGAKLQDAKYDAKTVFPDGMLPPLEMKWAGKGRNPFFPEESEPTELQPLSYEEMLEQLRSNTQILAYHGAKEMLKSQRFQLFSDVADARVFGVVRSQSSKDLVYACHLAADGSFGCCTQNLKTCGGMRGKVCKHIMVLLLGLARAGKLAPERAHLWVKNSARQRPTLDGDGASKIFLKYQSAQAAELDWRPTETVPEDFLSL